jgi:hypothetical protein
MQKLLFSIPVLVLIAGANAVLAQNAADPSAVQDLKKVDSVPPATARTLTEQAGTQEPSSKVPNTSRNDVFVNGVSTVAGAPTDTDTAPAKFSARTAADDALPIAGYRLKLLAGNERREIAQQLSSTRESVRSNDSIRPMIGVEIPAEIARGLDPMPEAMAAKFPGLRGTGFMRSQGKTLVVDLDNSIVVGVFEG